MVNPQDPHDETCITTPTLFLLNFHFFAFFIDLLLYIFTIHIKIFLSTVRIRHVSITTMSKKNRSMGPVLT